MIRWWILRSVPLDYNVRIPFLRASTSFIALINLTYGFVSFRSRHLAYSTGSWIKPLHLSRYLKEGRHEKQKRSVKLTCVHQCMQIPFRLKYRLESICARPNPRASDSHSETSLDTSSPVRKWLVSFVKEGCEPLKSASWWGRLLKFHLTGKRTCKDWRIMKLSQLVRETLLTALRIPHDWENLHIKNRSTETGMLILCIVLIILSWHFIHEAIIVPEISQSISRNAIVSSPIHYQPILRLQCSTQQPFSIITSFLCLQTIPSQVGRWFEGGTIIWSRIQLCLKI